MADIHDKYEQRHIYNINNSLKNIDAIYAKAIKQATALAAGRQLPSGTFKLSKIPVLGSNIERIITQFNTDLLASTMNGIAGEWNLANQKNNTIIDRRIAGRRLANSDLRVTLYDPNKKALNAFIARRENGLKLSDRVWKNTQRFRNELEAGLGVGISRGQSAAEMTRDIKSYLNEPDKLFRRVKDEKANLKLSKAAREYHPGQGVYRSSYKNAMRLTRSETNMAYRQSDQLRWQTMPFVVGYEIRLSNNHPQYDICDRCAGNYPKTFIWTGWHPQCLCYKVPIMMSDEEYDKYEDAILEGKTPRIRSSNQVNDVPAGFREWVKDNKERIDGWKSTPYWVRDNFKKGDINEALRIKTKPNQELNIGNYSLNEESLANLKKRGIFVLDPQLTISNFNSHLKGFNLDELFDDFDRIGEKHGIEWTSRSIKGGGSSSNMFQIIHFGRSEFGEVNVNRIFKTVNGKTEVYHALLTVPNRMQGGGLSREILGSYYQQYKNAAITKIRVQANINIGGYAWARYGFAAYERYELDIILSDYKGILTAAQSKRIKDIVDTHYLKNPNTYFPMRKIADLGRGKQNEYGKKLLLGTNWHGELDLTNKKVVKMFEDYLYGKK
jgi:hypothetical protein